MKISLQFSKFYHGVVIKECLSVPLITVQDIKIGGHVFRFSPKGVATGFHGKLDALKQLLKAVNLDYPRDNKGKPVSTTKITTKQLMQHIESVIKMVAESGYELDFVREEYERIKITCGIM